MSRPTRSFTLTELLLVIVIIGFISALGIQGFFFLVRRARVQAVALEVAGWLEIVRNVAANEVNASENQGGCVVTFTPLANMAAGDSLATLDQACTLSVPQNVLLIPQEVQQDSVTIAGDNTIIFTPRGLWTDAGGDPTATFQLNITLDSGGPLRCVRLTPTLGSVEVGRPPNSAGLACTEWQTL